MKNKEFSLRKVINYLINNSQEIARAILLSWCLLPFVMSLVYIVIALDSGKIIYNLLIKIAFRDGSIFLSLYIYLFFILGLVTILFALFYLSAGFKQIFNKQQLKQNSWFFVLTVLLGWTLICTLCSDDIYNAIFDFDARVDGFYSYVVYGSILICGLMIKKKEDRLLIVKTFISVISYLAIILFLKHLDEELFGAIFPVVNSPVFHNRNHFAYLLCMATVGSASLFVFNHDKRRYFYLALMIIDNYALLINDTLGSIIAVLFGLLFLNVIYYLHYKKFNIAPLIPFVAYIGLVILAYANVLPWITSFGTSVKTFGQDTANLISQQEGYENGGSFRIGLWKDTLARIMAKPIFGYGPSGLNGQYAISNNDAPHNEYLAFAAYNGVVGLMLYVACFIIVACKRFKTIKATSDVVLISASMFVTYLVSAFFGNSIFYSHPYMWICFGLIAIDENEQQIINLQEVTLTEKDLVVRSTKLNKIARLLIILLILIALAFGYLNLKSEKIRENADIQAMLEAETFAKLYYRNGLIDLGQEYYFDENNLKLVDINEDAPEPYGYGTKMVSLDEIDKLNYEYDQNLDYRNKVIIVCVVYVENDQSVIDVRWN